MTVEELVALHGDWMRERIGDVEPETELEHDIVEYAGLLETTTAAEVIGYLREERAPGTINPAEELIGQSASLQEACMNQRKADGLWALVGRVAGGER